MTTDDNRCRSKGPYHAFCTAEASLGGQLARAVSLGAVHHQLEVHGAASLVAVVEDVFSPGLALYVDQDARCKVGKDY